MVSQRQNASRFAYEYVWNSEAILALFLDGKGRIVEANPYAVSLLGSAAVGIAFREILVDFDNSLSLVELAGAGDSRLLHLSAPSGLLDSFWLRFYRADDGFLVFGRRDLAETHPLQTEIVALHNELSNMARQLSKKNHELLAAHERLLVLQTQLTHAMRLSIAGELVAGIAHEVNQPLYAVVNYAKACAQVLDGDPPDTSSAQKWLEKIAAAAGRAGELVRRFRDFVQWKEPERSTVAVRELVDDALAMVEFEVQKLGIRVEKALPETSLAIRVDRTLIHQALVNLLRNACEAMESCPAGARGLTVSAVPASGFIELSVADSGPGIGGHNPARLFDQFTTTKPDHLGIGLAICKTIAESHGGELHGADTPGGGAIFTLSLPV